jgi:hypothetical protein
MLNAFQNWYGRNSELWNRKTCRISNYVWADLAWQNRPHCIVTCVRSTATLVTSHTSGLVPSVLKHKAIKTVAAFHNFRVPANTLEDVQELDQGIDLDLDLDCGFVCQDAKYQNIQKIRRIISNNMAYLALIHHHMESIWDHMLGIVNCKHYDDGVCTKVHSAAH